MPAAFDDGGIVLDADVDRGEVGEVWTEDPGVEGVLFGGEGYGMEGNAFVGDIEGEGEM